MASRYKIPSFNPKPVELPSFRPDSTAVLHIGHCATTVFAVDNKQINTTKTRILKRFFIAKRDNTVR